MREVPPLTSNDLAVMVRSWVERARAIAVEPDVGVVESYLWVAELSKLHNTANWQVLGSALNARVLRACGGVDDALSWPSLFLAQAVRAMKLQWTDDEQHVKIIRKWAAQAPHATAFKESHLVILCNTVQPEDYLALMRGAHFALAGVGFTCARIAYELHYHKTMQHSVP